MSFQKIKSTPYPHQAQARIQAKKLHRMLASVGGSSRRPKERQMRMPFELKVPVVYKVRVRNDNTTLIPIPTTWEHEPFDPEYEYPGNEEYLFEEDRVTITPTKETFGNGLIELEKDEIEWNPVFQVDKEVRWEIGTKVFLVSSSSETVEAEFPDGERRCFILGEFGLDYDDCMLLDLATAPDEYHEDFTQQMEIEEQEDEMYSNDVFIWPNIPVK